MRRVKSVQFLDPSEENAVLVRRRVNFWLFPSEIILRFALHITASGRQHLPPDVPLLFVSNHVGLFDPLAIVLKAKQPVCQLATVSNFRSGIVGGLFSHFGGIPKKKFEPDVTAIRRLKRWTGYGISVGVFPEGERTWDGRTLPLVPGIEKLVRLLGLPVVTMRIINADRQSPRWAENPRWGRVHLEFHEPKTFSRRDSLDEIREYVRRGITVDPDDCPRWPVIGLSLAAGLPNLLFACPECLTPESLVTHRSRMTCKNCGGKWRVTTENRLVAESRVHDWTIAEVVDLLEERFSHQWIMDKETFERNGIVLESGPMVLLDITDEESQMAGKGRLRLDAENLTVQGEHAWQTPLVELRAIAFDMRRRLTFRCQSQYYEIVLPTESVVKWHKVLQHWSDRAQEADPSSAHEAP